jgi:hypothetical protein
MGRPKVVQRWQKCNRKWHSNRQLRKFETDRSNFIERTVVPGLKMNKRRKTIAKAILPSSAF